MSEPESLASELNSRLADALAAICRAGELARQLERAAPPHQQEAWKLVEARLRVTRQHLAGVMDPIGLPDDATRVGAGRAHYARK